MHKKAQNMLEIGLIASVVVIVSLVVFTEYNHQKMRIANMSNVNMRAVLPTQPIVGVVYSGHYETVNGESVWVPGVGHYILDDGNLVWVPSSGHFVMINGKKVWIPDEDPETAGGSGLRPG